MSKCHRLSSGLVGLALAVSTLVACSSGSDDAAPESTTATSTAATGSDPSNPADAPFPVTVPHEHGSTVVAAAPQRVITLGYSDQDYVLAFGVAPIAVTDWYGDYEAATWEWAQDELGDARPVVLNQGAFTGTAAYNYEQITELDPDLIIALYTDMNADQYATLSAIAPTIAPSGSYPEFGMPWQETTRTVGLALGQPERAEELIADVDGLLAAAAADHPEFAGLEMVVAEQFEPGTSFARSATDPRTKLMTALGFVLPDEIAELAGDLDGATISDEEMELLDRDLLAWNVGYEPELRAENRVQGPLPATRRRQGRPFGVHRGPADRRRAHLGHRAEHPLRGRWSRTDPRRRIGLVTGANARSSRWCVSCRRSRSTRLRHAITDAGNGCHDRIGGTLHGDVEHDSVVVAARRALRRDQLDALGVGKRGGDAHSDCGRTLESDSVGGHDFQSRTRDDRASDAAP